MAITLNGSTGITSDGNVVAASNVTATGNVTATYFIGNGSQLTGISGSGTNYANANAVAYANAGWAGNIIPSGNNVYSLGNATNQWNDIYVSNATIFMNNVPVSLTASNVLTVNGANVVTSTAGGNININNIVSNSNIAIDTSAEKVTVSVGLSDWVFDETGVLTAPGEIETVGNISAGYFLGNGSQLTGLPAAYGNANVATYLPVFGGNILGNNITANLVESLGNIIAEGRVEAANINGNTAAFNQASIVGNISASYFLGNGSQLTGIAASTGNVTFTGNVISTTGTNNLLINLNGEDFIANTAGGGAIGLYSGNSQIAINNDTPGIEITSLNVNLVARAEGDINLDATAANGVVDIESAGNTTITVNGNVWTFDDTGVLTTPGNITITGNISGGNTQVQNIRTIEGTVHVGQGAGLTNQGTYAIAMGRFAGSQDQGGAGLAIGQLAGQTSQGISAIALGLYAAANTQSANAVAIGTYAGQITQGVDAIAIGQLAGNSAQGTLAVAIGQLAGSNTQGGGAVAVGYYAGQNSQGVLTTAIGAEAGRYNQSGNATAVGSRAGNWNQGAGAVAIGRSAAENVSNSGSQGLNAVAIGNAAGYVNQGNSAIAIGAYSGLLNQGQYSIAIGTSAGRDSGGGQGIGNNSIILNATGANFSSTTANTFYVTPVRNDVSNIGQVVFYNTTSKEITYGNTISVAGNITTDGFLSASNIGVSTTVTTQTVVTDPGPLSGLTAAWGARGFITDGNLAAVGNFGAQVSGGGANGVPVWSDGANWFIG